MSDPSPRQSPRLSTDEIKELRREAGRWLKELRLSRGLSQMELQKIVAPDLQSKFVSQVEIGSQTLMSSYYEVWAGALNVDTQHFARNLMKYYNPGMFSAIFEHDKK